jgi:hypothetical protein
LHWGLTNAGTLFQFFSQRSSKGIPTNPALLQGTASGHAHLVRLDRIHGISAAL